MDKFNAIESESPRKRKRRSHDDEESPTAPIDGVNQQPALQLNYASASHSAASPNKSTPLRNFGWVEKSHFVTIASGTFDVNNLPQLLHDEDARRNHLIQTIHGVIFNIESDEPRIVRGMTDFQASFPNIETFVSAFVVYSAIRTAHQPEYGSPFMAWLETILRFASRIPWANVLDYAIDFIRTYQSMPPASWLESDSNMLAIHFLIPSQSSFPNSHSNSLHERLSQQDSGDTRRGTRYQNGDPTPRHLQTCRKFNRKRCGQKCPFGRLHICYSCGKSGHPCRECRSRRMKLPEDRD